MISRVLVAVAAVLVLAWFAVLERDVRLQSAAAAASRDNRAAAADRDLRRSTLLNPGTDPDLRRAVIATGQGQLMRARRLIEGVLRREPQNFEAWTDLLLVVRSNDPAARARATRVMARLDPLIRFGDAARRP